MADGYIWFSKLKRTNQWNHNGFCRQIERRLIIFRRTCTPAIFFGSTRTPGHLILGVLAKFSGVYITPVLPLTEALAEDVRKGASNERHKARQTSAAGARIEAPNGARAAAGARHNTFREKM